MTPISDLVPLPIFHFRPTFKRYFEYHKCRSNFHPLLGFPHISFASYSIPILDALKHLHHFTHHSTIPCFDPFHRPLNLGFISLILIRPRIELLLHKPYRHHLKFHALLARPSHHYTGLLVC